MAVDTQIASRQKRGQDLYRQAKYIEALECFNEIINGFSDPSLSVLDIRASTHIKLDDLLNALKDGKRMITLGKTQATGYLRTGQILQKMGKDDTALGIYKYGLRNVPASCEDIKRLRHMHDKLSARCSPPKAVDPLLMLPLELAEIVFGYMSFNNIVSLLRVSKQWRDLIGSMPSLWRHLDLSKARRAVKISSVKACARRSKGQLTHATLFRADSRNGEAIKHIIGNCRKLEFLELKDGLSNNFLVHAAPLAPRLSTLIIGRTRDITLDCVSEILHHCPTLIRAEFHSIFAKVLPAKWEGEFHNLRTLILCGDLKSPRPKSIDLLVWRELFPRISRIRELTMRFWAPSREIVPEVPDFTQLPGLQSLDFDGFMMEIPPRLPLCLQTLTMCHDTTVHHDPAITSSMIPTSKPDVPDLTSLVVGSAHRIPPEQLSWFLEAGKGKIASLALIDSLPSVTAILHEHLRSGSLANLKELELKAAEITDETLELLAAHCPRLVTLRASSNVNITGVGVRAVVTKPGDMLRCLDLTYCSGVSNDAVVWSRTKGVDVTFKFPDIKSGKRIRLS